MNIDEIKRLISYSIRKDGHFRVLEATLTLRSDLRFDSYSGMKVLEMARRNLEEIVLRALFEDQSRALWDALDELYRCDPWNTDEWRKAIEKLMKEARYQKPEFGAEYSNLTTMAALKESRKAKCST